MTTSKYHLFEPLCDCKTQMFEWNLNQPFLPEGPDRERYLEVKTHGLRSMLRPKPTLVVGLHVMILQLQTVCQILIVGLCKFLL